MEPTTARGCSPIELPSRTSAASTSAGPRTWMERARIPETEGAALAELPGKALAQELVAQSREERRRTPAEGVIRAVNGRSLSGDPGEGEGHDKEFQHQCRDCWYGGVAQSGRWRDLEARRNGPLGRKSGVRSRRRSDEAERHLCGRRRRDLPE